MMSTLSILQEAIEEYTAIEATHPSITEGSIAALCSQVLVDMSLVYRKCSTTQMAAQDTNQSYIFLVHLIDAVTSQPMLRALFPAVENLLQRFEQRYGHHLQPSNPLPLYQQQSLRGEVDQRLPSIVQKLRQKNIPSPYLDELGYAMKSLFHPAKQPDLGHAHCRYLPRLLNALEAMADDKRSKPWSARFIHLLVNHNFNYMGFYNRWKKEQDKLFADAQVEGTVQTALINLEAALKPYNSNGQQAYHIGHKSLLDHMQDYLQIQKKRSKLADTAVNPLGKEHPYIPLKLNGHQSKLFFHALYAVNIFPANTKEEAAKAVSANIRTESGTQLTYQSLSRYDRDKLTPHAPFVIRKLKEMTKFLEDDFR